MKHTEPNDDLCARVLRGLGLAVIVANRRGLITGVNPAAETLLGAKSADLAGRPVSTALRLVDLETGKALRIPSSRFFRREPKRRLSLRATLKLSETSAFPVHAFFSPQTDRGGHVTGVVAVLSDIREAVARERQVMDRHRAEVIRGVASRMAEDFQSWLTTILGHAATVTENLLPNTRAYEEAKEITETARQASALIKRLVSVADAADGATRPGAEHVCPIEAMRNAVTLAQATFMRKGVEARIEAPERLPAVLAGADQLVACLLNILRNAAEAMPKGGVVTLSARQRTAAGKPYVVIGVRDNGSGMTRETLDRLFTPFFTTKPSGSGMGLGLTLVRSLVDGWGGHVSVRSKPAEGTTVRLFLPRASARTERTPPVCTGSVLVIDDNPDDILSIQTALEASGFRVIAVSTAEDGLAVYRRQRESVHLVIIDLLMPGKDGGEVAKEVAATDSTLPIIMTSGFTRDFVRSRLGPGSWGFLQKPVESEALLELVRRLLADQLNMTPPAASKPA